MSDRAETSGPETLGLGLIGCGAFGEYCMETYSGLAGICPVAAADRIRPAADRVAERFGVPAVYDAAELIARDDVDIVHLATPPSTHYELGMAALNAGKHVLCEKPLATCMADADELLAAAAAGDLIIPVNFVLRYNPVTDAVKAIIDSGVLGESIHGSLENFAGDEKLDPDHWFWNKSVSGGIFIEHGVHFFDLYRHWFGEAEIIAAHAEVRDGSTAEDRVMCITRHEGGVTVNHYHGFDQPARLDRQSHHLLMEWGDVYVYGWIPESLTVTAIVDETGLAELERLCPGATLEVLASYDTAEAQQCRGRWADLRVTQKVRLTWDGAADKDTLYRKGVEGLMIDQLAFIADRSHRRRVTESNGRDSLALAVTAAEVAAGQAVGASVST